MGQYRTDAGRRTREEFPGSYLVPFFLLLLEANAKTSHLHNHFDGVAAVDEEMQIRREIEEPPTKARGGGERGRGWGHAGNEIRFVLVHVLAQMFLRHYSFSLFLFSLILLGLTVMLFSLNYSITLTENLSRSSFFVCLEF